MNAVIERVEVIGGHAGGIKRIAQAKVVIHGHADTVADLVDCMTNTMALVGEVESAVRFLCDAGYDDGVHTVVADVIARLKDAVIKLS